MPKRYSRVASELIIIEQDLAYHYAIDECETCEEVLYLWEKGPITSKKQRVATEHLSKHLPRSR